MTEQQQPDAETPQVENDHGEAVPAPPLDVTSQDDESAEESRPATLEDQDNGQDDDGASYVEQRQERYEAESEVVEEDDRAPVEEGAPDGQERGTDSDVGGAEQQ